MLVASQLVFQDFVSVYTDKIPALADDREVMKEERVLRSGQHSGKTRSYKADTAELPDVLAEATCSESFHTKYDGSTTACQTRAPMGSMQKRSDARCLDAPFRVQVGEAANPPLRGFASSGQASVSAAASVRQAHCMLPIISMVEIHRHPKLKRSLMPFSSFWGVGRRLSDTGRAVGGKGAFGS